MTHDSAEFQVSLGLDEADDAEALRHKASRFLGRPLSELPDVHVVRRSIDARRGRVRFELLLSLAPQGPIGGPLPREVGGPGRVIVVGAGPAGIFCAYQLARHGIRVLVLDRGKQVQPRRHDLKALNARGIVNPECNYCFGEGGAGTYSDGKLYTRSHKRGNVRDVLEVLALHGASREILVDARPHIGSNRLPIVVTALRERLEGVGVEFRFDARVTRLLLRGAGATRRIAGVALADGSELETDALVLATGHSARDVLELLEAEQVLLEPKAFALGVRIEHPQPLINQMQYGRHAGHARLPAAYYRCATTVERRGVYSFCMCPGGFIVPASTEVDGLVVNG
ncbi:MAG TPA: FAD-dependent oxidoreductase, partial [Polyangiaceae bacterium]|nr:FAD-dependent oxidoreductase [Polyangiaceae bacterium]